MNQSAQHTKGLIIFSSSKQNVYIFKTSGCSPTMLSAFPQTNFNFCILTHYQTTNFRLFQTKKKFADDNFKFDENGRKLSKQVEITVGKGEIARHEQFLLFPVFSKGLFPRDVKRWCCVKCVNYFVFRVLRQVDNFLVWQRLSTLRMLLFQFNSSNSLPHNHYFQRPCVRKLLKNCG